MGEGTEGAVMAGAEAEATEPDERSVEAGAGQAAEAEGGSGEASQAPPEEPAAFPLTMQVEYASSVCCRRVGKHFSRRWGEGSRGSWLPHRPSHHCKMVQLARLNR